MTVHSCYLSKVGYLTISLIDTLLHHGNYRLTFSLAGIAIMALGALSEGTPISIVPVGLTYFSAHKFRSRAVIEFGDIIHVSSSLIHDFKNGKKRGAVGTMMKDISEALASVTVSAPNFETLQVCSSLPVYINFAFLARCPAHRGCSS